MTKYFHQTLAACALLGASLAFVGCEKNNSTPTGTVGNITGKVIPVGAVTLVTIRDSANSETFTATPHVSSGDFTFFDLKPHTYTVSFTTSPTFATFTPRVARVKAGETFDLGTISAVSNVVGCIKGVVSPLGSVTKITASSTLRTVIANPSPTTGQFLFTGLPAGNYSLSFTTVVAPVYVVPTPRTVTVIVADTVDMDTIKVIPNSGTITGRAMPLGAFDRVFFNRSGLANSSIGADPGTGRFAMTGLVPGDYIISGKPLAGFIPPPVRTATVTAGSTTDVGSMTMLPEGNTSSGGTMTFKVDGVSKTATSIKATRSGTFLIISGRVGSDKVILALANASSPGPYPLSGPSATSYAHYDKNGLLYTTSLLGAIGRADVTAISLGTRTVSGTFSFSKVLPANVINNPALHNITSGKFTDINF